MSTSLSLLTLPNAQAQREMVGELLEAGVALDDLTISAPTRVDESTLMLTVHSSEGALGRPDWPYRGDAHVTFERVDLGQLLDGLDLWLQVPLPTTTTALAQILANVFQIRIDEGDVVDEVVNFLGFSGETRLRCSAASQRWFGSVPLRVYRAVGGGA